MAMPIVTRAHPARLPCASHTDNVVSLQPAPDAAARNLWLALADDVDACAHSLECIPFETVSGPDTRGRLALARRQAAALRVTLECLQRGETSKFLRLRPGA